MIGIIVSGSAVPTAASTDPTAPSASSSLRPNHSMPLVNSSAPSEDDDERDDEDEDVHGQASMPKAVTTTMAMTSEDEQRDEREAALAPCARKPTPATTTRPIGVAMTQDDAEPQEARGLEGEQRAHEADRVERRRRAAASGSIAGHDQQARRRRRAGPPRRRRPTP